MGIQESKALSTASTIASDGRTSITRSSQAKKTKTFTIYRQIYDPRYGGNIKLVKRSKNTRDYLLIQKRVESQLALEREMRALNRRIFSPHPNQLRVDSFTHHDEQSCCNVEWIINIYIEYLDKDLEQEVTEKRQKLSYYLEHELIYLIENLIMGLSSFQKNQKENKDLRPSHIFIDNFGVYKYMDHDYINFDFARTLESSKKRLLAPELLNPPPESLTSEVCKTDVFSLGMIMLEAATLLPSFELYDNKTSRINVKELQDRLNQVRTRYSQNVYQLLASALELEPSHRANAETLCERLAELGDSLAGKDAVQSYVLDRVHANQGISMNDLSIDRGITLAASGSQTVRDHTPNQKGTNPILLSGSPI